MTVGFTTLSDDYYERAEFAGVGLTARMLDTEVMVWSNRIRTDGLVPKKMLPQIGWLHPDLDADTAELVASGAWTDTGDAFQLDWSHQMTKAQWAERQKENEETKKANARRAERSRRHRAGNHSWCDPSSDYCKPLGRGVIYEQRFLDTLTADQLAALSKEGDRDVTRDVRARAVLPTPTTTLHPLPLPAEGKGRGRGVKGDAGGATRAPASAGAPAGGGRTAGTRKKNPRGGPRGFHRCGAPRMDGGPCGTAVRREGERCPHHRPPEPSRPAATTTSTTATHAERQVPTVPKESRRVLPDTSEPPQRLAKAHPYCGPGGDRDSECVSCGFNAQTGVHYPLMGGGWGSEYQAHVAAGESAWAFSTEVGS